MTRKIATTALILGALALPTVGFAAGDTKTADTKPAPPAATADTKPAAPAATADTKPAAPATANKPDSPKTLVQDSVITAKIKAEFMKDPQVSALAIKVDTDDKGIVQLTGTAKSKAEADKAVKIAQATEGVKQVKNDIKVQP